MVERVENCVFCRAVVEFDRTQERLYPQRVGGGAVCWEGFCDGEVVFVELAECSGGGRGDDRGGDRAGRVAHGCVFGGSLRGRDGILTHDPLTLAIEFDDDDARFRMPRKPSVEGRHTTSLHQCVGP